MECFEPGQVIILPREGGRSSLQNLLAETEDVEIIYSVEDILDYYVKEGTNNRKEFITFPVIVKVPEGQELEFSKRYRSFKNVSASMPNFRISPLQSDLTLNKETIDDLITSLHSKPGSYSCGNDVKIVIIDTGIDPSMLPFPHKICDKQYSTDIPVADLRPFDNVGHGTSVAYIVNSIAPGSEIFSIKMMEKEGNVGGLISAIYLAEAEFEPDIYNLSLAISCDLGSCAYCGNDIMINSRQLELLFEVVDRQRRGKSLPLFVAAAGNNTSTIKMPASFPNVLSVGSYMPSSPFKGYTKINSSKFILAPGGLKDKANCIAYKPGFSKETPFEGTSFAAAFVTGVSARFLCSTKQSPCRNFISLPTTKYKQGREFVMDCLSLYSSKNIPGYSVDKHGLGVVQYN